jgi:3-oxoacyl-[acyl-carrier protein] reductase
VAHDDLEGLSPEDFLDIYKINVVGAYTMTRACAPEMKKHGKGSVVNSGLRRVVEPSDGRVLNKLTPPTVSSLAGVMGIGSCVAYAASKGELLQPRTTDFSDWAAFYLTETTPATPAP